MKFLKRFFVFLLVFVVLLVAFALVAPIIFKDKIVENVKYGINQTVNAEIDFADINVSFLRSFPAINLTIDDFSVVGIDTFAGYPLATGKQASVDLDFWSVISGSETGNYEIEAVKLIDPDIRLLLLNENLANYLIVKESEDPGAGAENTSQLLFQLKKYEIENGHFIYDDRLTKTYVEAKNLDHSGTGDFTLDVFDLDTESKFGSFTLKQDGMAYLKEVSGTLDAVMNIDLVNSKYTFLKNELVINALQVNFDGSIAMPSDDIIFDLSFQAPGTDFRQLWSLIPAAYTKDYADVKTNGTFSLKGKVTGPLNVEIPRYPAFTFDISVADGSVQYPGSPVAINGISTQVNVNSPSSDLNQIVVNVPNFKMNLGGDPFNGNFKLVQPISNPTVDARLDGKIDLNKWGKLMPLEGVNELSGQIDADLTMKGVSQRQIEAADYGSVIMDGTLGITNLVYAADGLPRVDVQTATANFTPRNVEIPQFAMKLGRSDLSGSATVSNLLAYFSPEKTMTGSVKVNSNYFDADEWVSEEATAASPKSPAEINAASIDDPATSQAELFNRFDFKVDADVKEIKYGTYQLKNSHLDGQFQANQMIVNDLSTTMGESTLRGSGRVINAWDYYFEDAVLGGKMNFQSDYINLDDFMETEATAASTTAAGETASTAAIPVPENINLVVDLNATKVKYTDMLLEDVAGELLIKDKQVIIQNGTTKVMGGNMLFEGAYDTSEPGDPEFRFKYDLKSLAFSKAFQYLNSVKALAPIAEFVTGQFNSDLVVSGKLGQDLYPVLSTVDAQGFLQTIDASLASIQPLQKLGNALNVKALTDRINLKGLKSWFKIEQGTVAIEPFKLKIAGIPMQIQGRHGLDMEMDYSIQAAVPKSLIEGNIVTGSAIRALDQLAGQAQKLGLNVQQGDTLNFAIGLTGSFQDTKTSIKLLGANGNSSGSLADNVVNDLKQQAKDEVDSKINDVKTTAQDRLALEKQKVQVAKDSIATLVRLQRQRAADSVATLIRLQKEKAANQATSTIKDAIGVGKDTTAAQSVEDIKKELEKFNPFKKKKKDGGS